MEIRDIDFRAPTGPVWGMWEKGGRSMLRSLTKSFATAAILCTTLGSASADQVAKRSDATIVNDLQYLLYTPEGYDGPDQKFPLVVWLHGGGQSGSDIERLKTGGLPKMIAEGSTGVQFGCVAR